MAFVVRSGPKNGFRMDVTKWRKLFATSGKLS